MGKHSEKLLAGLLGLGEQSSRKSHYPELLQQLQELERERNRYKWLFEHANYGIFQASVEKGFHAVNPALLNMLDYDHDNQLTTMGVVAVEKIFCRGFEELGFIHQQLQKNGSVQGYETRLRARSGHELDVLINVFVNTDEPDLLEGFVANISERKKAERRILQINQELEQRVAERTIELQKARDLAEAANSSKDKYLAAASHDLLQPLNAARLLISTLQERRLPSFEHHLIQRTHLALEGAEDLLSDLLDIARLDQQAVKPSEEVCSIAELYESLVSEFEPVAAQAGVRLTAHLSRWKVKTDPHLLMRILRNFMSNACRYTPAGRILLGARKVGQSVRLEVWDTGVGLTEEQVKGVFQEFCQFSTTTLQNHKGVGLGLAIVERLAALLQAKVFVRSAIGHGSCFSIELPLAIYDENKTKISFPSFPAFGNSLEGRRILVIDNEENILMSMAALLDQWQCEVSIATGYKEALCALQEIIPEIILVDLHLNCSENGLNVVKKLREYFAKDIPAVLITADHSDQFEILRKKLNIPVLNKPVRPNKLRAILSHRLAFMDS